MEKIQTVIARCPNCGKRFSPRDSMENIKEFEIVCAEGKRCDTCPQCGDAVTWNALNMTFVREG